MSIRLFVLAALCTATLVATFPLLRQDTVVAGISLNQQQTQETTIRLKLNDLVSPHVLKIDIFPKTSEFTGYIELNGKRLQTLEDHETKINLSPSLTPGVHRLKIVGQYHPADASVTVKFEGATTQISQQISGSGDFNQTMIIDVRR